VRIDGWGAPAFSEALNDALIARHFRFGRPKDFDDLFDCRPHFRFARPFKWLGRIRYRAASMRLVRERFPTQFFGSGEFTGILAVLGSESRSTLFVLALLEPIREPADGIMQHEAKIMVAVEYMLFTRKAQWTCASPMLVDELMIMRKRTGLAAWPAGRAVPMMC
jgi:hypothetical protein